MGDHHGNHTIRYRGVHNLYVAEAGVLMIFKGTWQQVLDGTKTQTRRPVKRNHGCISFMNDPELETIVKSRWNKNGKLIHRRIYQVGKTYAVQSGRGKKSLGRILITKIRRENVQSISCADCIAEGLKSSLKKIDATMDLLNQWEELWNSLYAGTEFAYENNPQVWVLEFELVEKY